MLTNSIIANCSNLANTLLVNNSLCPIVSVYYVCSEKGQWDLVTDEQEAKTIDTYYRLATKADLIDYMAASSVFRFPVRIKEGIAKYFEHGSFDWDSEDEFVCGYELVQKVVAA